MPSVYELYNDEQISEYRGVKFAFSNANNKKQFDKNIDQFVNFQTIRLVMEYDVPVRMCHFEDFLAMSLYNKIEKKEEDIERDIEQWYMRNWKK